jgi:hypothetical protein
MGCDCATVCPKARHCAVMEVLKPKPGESWCVAICDPDPEPSAEPPPLRLDSAVNVDTRNIQLAQLGEFIARYFEGDLLIPARAASEVVEVTQKDTTLGALLDSVGLVVAPDRPAAA